MTTYSEALASIGQISEKLDSIDSRLAEAVELLQPRQKAEEPPQAVPSAFQHMSTQQKIFDIVGERPRARMLATDGLSVVLMFSNQQSAQRFYKLVTTNDGTI